MSENSTEFSVSLERIEDYQFRVSFGGGRHPPLLIDEPPPLGGDAGPTPARLLAAAVGGCLSASLLFCLTKSRAEVSDLGATVNVQIVRGARGRLRVGGISVTLRPDLAPADRHKLERCLALYEDFCIVTASIRQGIPVEVHVEPPPAS